MDSAASIQLDLQRRDSQRELLSPRATIGSVTDQISDIVLRRPTTWSWLAGFAVAFGLLVLFGYTIGYLLIEGVGIWGVNIPVAWAFAIVNFVWWLGVAHAGTLISGMLLLLNQDWRIAIGRFAEAMTILAIACAGLFPLLHLGRPGFFYWMLPYPNTMDVWPQFRSLLVWDVWAILIYFVVSVLFWYLGLIPDFATLRDRSSGRVRRVVWSILAMGWRGEVDHWHLHQTASRLLAGLATALVTLHSVMAFGFATTLVPGWHSTLLAPYFVAGAMFSGFAMVLVLIIPLRAWYGLKGLITARHLDTMAKLMLAAGLMVAYGYVIEGFTAWYSADEFAMTAHIDRLVGVYAPIYWSVIVCNVLIPQMLWFRRARVHPLVMWPVALIVLIGMWLERYHIVIVGLYNDYLPPMWGRYLPTFWDWSLFAGSFGLFFVLFFLLLRFVPVISMFEMRKLIWQERAGDR